MHALLKFLLGICLIDCAYKVDPVAASSQIQTAVSSFSSAKVPITGRATVIDGDTIEIHGERIRFNGIDAPESAQLCKNAKGKSYRCGAIAANALDKFLAAASPTRCEFVGRDRYGRFVGNCYRSDNANIAAYLVRNGLAMDWPRYSRGAYADEQEAAKAEGLGIWAGEFTPPWEWRAAQRNSEAQEPGAPPVRVFYSNSSASNCNIKGNISSKDERIYHTPGQKYYGRTTGMTWMILCSSTIAPAVAITPH
jgi:endonuclease YncB( thermonuclease family)